MTRLLTGRNGKLTNVPSDNFAMRHAHQLDGKWVYSRVTLDCGCVKPVANPLREITINDQWHCWTHERDVKIVKVEPATLDEQDTLCTVEVEE